MTNSRLTYVSKLAFKYNLKLQYLWVKPHAIICSHLDLFSCLILNMQNVCVCTSAWNVNRLSLQSSITLFSAEIIMEIRYICNEKMNQREKQPLSRLRDQCKWSPVQVQTEQDLESIFSNLFLSTQIKVWYLLAWSDVSLKVNCHNLRRVKLLMSAKQYCICS